MEINIAPFEPESFEYEALPTPSSIRLLTFYGSKTRRGIRVGKSHLIEGLLRTVDLDDAPIYKTLSYSWGYPWREKPRPDQDLYHAKYQFPLTINGKLFFVGRNLYNGLRQLVAFSDKDRGIDKQQLPFYKTELIRSSELGQIKRVLYCLEHGADVRMKDFYGKTALHYAAAKGHLDVTKLLLRYGADTNLVDTSNRTPLEYLHEQDSAFEGITNLLRDHIAEPSPIQHTVNEDFFQFDLWIDSICINQNDITERNSQVAMMARIYSSSISTVIWLGFANTQTMEALSIVTKTAEPELGSAVFVSDDFERQKNQAMNTIARRSWFTRRWVIQEFCLAQEFEMYCGRVEIDIRRLPEWGDGAVNAVISLRYWYLNHNTLSQWPPHEKQPLPTLLALAVTTWGYESTDLRDCIFSLIGLAARASNVDFKVDYNRSVVQVYTEVARRLMETRTELHQLMWRGTVVEPLHALTLIQIQPHTRLDGLPSWVPNFHQQLPARGLIRAEFRASGDTKPKIWPSDMVVLKVDACLLDKVVVVEQKTHMNEPGRGDFVANLDQWFGVASQDSSDQVVRIEDLWRTLMTDDDFFQASILFATEPVPRHDFKDFLLKHIRKTRENPDLYETLLHRLKISRNDSTTGLIPTIEEIEDEDQSSVNTRSKKSSRFEICFSAYYIQRVLFRALSGHLGLALNTVRPGDQIWLVAGTRTPFVLRPYGAIEGQFEFVADCYVHGWMYGEAVDGREDAIFHPIEIV